jgi:hypothetical protein
MHFQKQDLAGQDYYWNNDPTNELYQGQPSRRMFDRFNGNQVLFIINFYGSLVEGFTSDDGRAIEDQLLHHLPLETKSEISVFNWIRMKASGNEEPTRL